MKLAEKEGLTDIQRMIEESKVKLWKCTTQGEIDQVLKDLEGQTKIPMEQTDKFALLLQSFLVNQFEGVDKKSRAVFEPGTWERVCSMYLTAMGV